MINNKIIVFVHLFNNYSGSPKVLKQVINYFKNEGFRICLITNKSEGFLSDIKGIKYVYINYNWSNNKVKTLLSFIIAQFQIFYKIIKFKNSNVILYINTIMPIGAFIGGKIIDKPTICHVHESYVSKNLINRICQFSFEHFSNKAIFVSEYLKNCYKDFKKDSLVAYNFLEKDFINKAHFVNPSQSINDTNVILMVCSLRKFKGIYEFVELSKLLPDYKFELVLSSNEYEVEQFKNSLTISNNIEVFSNQTDLHPFYKRAKLILNLSNPNLWIETFGLTILEAMEYSIPCIVPNVGGPTELIIDGYNGFLVNPQNIIEVKNKIEDLVGNSLKYNDFALNAKRSTDRFNEKNEILKIRKFILND